jgi:hypothetical protein
MLPPDAKQWSNEQIVMFSRWLQNRNYTVFMSIVMLKRHLHKLGFPYYIIRAKKHASITHLNKYKHVFLLAIGTKEHHVAIRLRKHPYKFESAGGLWTHQLILALMVYARIIDMPRMPIDAGGHATLAFCIRAWNLFLDDKLQEAASRSI